MKRFATLLFILILIIGGFLLFRGGESDTSPESLIEVPENWELFESPDFNFTFSYPPQASISTEAGRTKITYLGPDNEPNTEITDGFTFYVRTQPLESQTLQEFAQQSYQQATQSPTGQDLDSEMPEQVSVNSRAGYQYRVESELGNMVDYLVLEAQGDQVFNVSYSVLDPNNTGYQVVIDTIVQTLEIEG